jgi:hypothetical protein
MLADVARFGVAPRRAVREQPVAAAFTELAEAI